MLCRRAPPILVLFPKRFDVVPKTPACHCARQGSCSSRVQDSRTDVSRRRLPFFVRRAASLHPSSLFALLISLRKKEGALL